jgi:hypothetical protein
VIVPFISSYLMCISWTERVVYDLKDLGDKVEISVGPNLHFIAWQEHNSNDLDSRIDPGYYGLTDG